MNFIGYSHIHIMHLISAVLKIWLKRGICQINSSSAGAQHYKPTAVIVLNKDLTKKFNTVVEHSTLLYDIVKSSIPVSTHH